MRPITLLVLLSPAALWLVCGLPAQGQKNDDAWKKIAGWREPMPKVKVLNGYELKIDEVRCRLFGVRLSNDAKTAEGAKRFLELYMQTFGEYFSIYNIDCPVSSKDKIPLIWLEGHSNGGWAQEALVQAGLVEVDYTSFEEYRFQVPTNAGMKEYDWKKCLKQAVSAHNAGKKPDVCWVSPHLDWPQATKK